MHGLTSEEHTDAVSMKALLPNSEMNPLEMEKLVYCERVDINLIRSNA